MATQEETSLRAAKAMITELTEELERLGQAPLVQGMVLQSGPEFTTVLRDGSVLRVPSLPKTKLLPGDSVLLMQDTSQIYQKGPGMPIGELTSVKSVISPTQAEIEVGGTTRVVFTGFTVKEGDRIMVDRTSSVAITKVAREQERFTVSAGTGVTWDHIGGQQEAKKQMLEAVEMPLRNPAIYTYYRKRPIKGVLLYGPPGCGKTMFGKAAATAVAEASGKGVEATGFLYVKGPEVLDPYVGVAEATIRDLFKRAREHKEKHGVPAVLFIDEADALLGNRAGRHAHMERTIVPTFLAEMDGLEDSGAMVILATNLPDSLDPAVTREGRIDRKVRVARPSADEMEAIFKIYFRDVPLARDLSVDTAAAFGRSLILEPARVYADVVMESGETRPFTMANIASGAMIAGIVDMASSIAMHRDIDAKAKTPTGISIRDIQDAVDHVFKANQHVDHKEQLLEFAGSDTINAIYRRTHAPENR